MYFKNINKQITHADRNATKSRDLSCFNIENTYGNIVVKKIIDSIKSSRLLENAALPDNYSEQDFFQEANQAIDGVDLDVSENKKNIVKTFLNRLLGCTVDIQNAIFEYFENAFESEIALAKREGRFECGINSIDLSSKCIFDIQVENTPLKDNRQIQFYQFKVKDGMNFEEVLGINSKNAESGPNMNGFYYKCNGKYKDMPILAIQASTGMHLIFQLLSSKMFF